MASASLTYLNYILYMGQGRGVEASTTADVDQASGSEGALFALLAATRDSNGEPLGPQ